MFDLFLWLLGICMFIDFVRWCAAEDSYYSRKPNFFAWMIASLIGNAFWAFILLIIIKIVQWVFS